jgi:hypothetical protein
MRRIHTALLSTVALVAGLSAQPVIAADLALKAPVAPAFAVPRWDGAFVSFSAGGTWTKADERFSDSGTSLSTLTNNDIGFSSTQTTTTQFVGSDSQ